MRSNPLHVFYRQDARARSDEGEIEGRHRPSKKKGRFGWGSAKGSRSPAAWLSHNMKATSTESSGTLGVCLQRTNTRESRVKKSSGYNLTQQAIIHIFGISTEKMLKEHMHCKESFKSPTLKPLRSAHTGVFTFTSPSPSEFFLVPALFGQGKYSFHVTCQRWLSSMKCSSKPWQWASMQNTRTNSLEWIAVFFCVIDYT